MAAAGGGGRSPPAGNRVVEAVVVALMIPAPVVVVAVAVIMVVVVVVGGIAFLNPALSTTTSGLPPPIFSKWTWLSIRASSIAIPNPSLSSGNCREAFSNSHRAVLLFEGSPWSISIRGGGNIIKSKRHESDGSQ